MNKIDYDEYNRLVTATLLSQVDWPSGEKWRRGQAYFNVLHQIRPDLASQVQGNHRLDPFHDDSRLAGFLAWVALHWGYEEDSD